MKQEEVQKMIELRNMLINQYNRLDGKANPGTAVLLQRDVASLIERSIGKLDSVLSEYVNIKSEK